MSLYISQAIPAAINRTKAIVNAFAMMKDDFVDFILILSF
jgi:hypothetical protein